MPTPISWWTWIELWIVVAGPLVGYLLTSWYSYKLLHRRLVAHVYWSWSFLYMQLAVGGLCIVRAHAIGALWSAGRIGAPAAVDPEWAVASWAVALGLLGHVYFLDRHPAWERPDEESRL